MDLQLILWGLAGFLAFYIFQLAKQVRNRSGWDFVLQTGFFSGASYMLNRPLVLLLRRLLPNCVVTGAGNTWRQLYPQVPLELVIGIMFSGTIVGILSAYMWKVGHPYLSNFAKLLSGRHRNLEFPDTFFKMTHELLGKIALIGTKSGKVYVGIINEVTSDPNETNRFLRFSPIMSGYRRQPDLKVVFNTNYVQEITQAQSDAQAKEAVYEMPNRDFLFPMSEVNSLARFDSTLHNKFVESNTTLIEDLNFHSDAPAQTTAMEKK